LAFALIASVVAVLWSWTHAAFLLYGDAEAHIHIARRLFDSHRPGITQLGSVWLPLPHLLLLPFLAVDSWWRSGFAPVIPSAACYLLGSLGLYLLARKWVSPAAASVALVLYATNPNLLYLQTTAMTEPLFLCEQIWSVLLLVEWYGNLDRNPVRSERLLWAVIAVLIAAVYTRYDGWIVGFLAWLVMAICLWRRHLLFRTSFVAASIVLLLAPVAWMAYNAVVFGDWLDFMRGPYSAFAIELRTASSAVDPHPGWHNPWISLVYFVKAAEMDAAALGWGESLFVIAALGAAWAWLRHGTSEPAAIPGQIDLLPKYRHSAVLWTLLLWIPLPFYAYSVSYGSVPIFLPVWKPFSWYNTRYGMELLPAFAFFVSFAVEAVLLWLRSRKPQPKYIRTLLCALFLLIAANVAEMLREHPLTFVEAQKNAAARGYYNDAIAAALRQLHAVDPASPVLMDTSSFPTIVPHAGLTYRQTINESDKQFYWAALGAPAAHASIVLAFHGDDIEKAVLQHPEHLRKYREFHAKDQLPATLYIADSLANAIPATSPTTAVPAQ
jgi:hypothetical protein